jgi:hypothetical protein
MKVTSKFAAIILCLVVCSSALGNQAPAPPATAAPAPPKATALNSPTLPTPPAADQQPSVSSDSCCSTCCQPKMVERTVCVPVPVRETKKVQCIEYSTEQHQQTITVMHCVPEKQTLTRDYIVMMPEKRTRTENYTVCKPVPSGDCCGTCKYVEEPRQRVVEYTVCVPQKKTCSYDVTVCKYVPEQKNIAVSVCVPHTVEKEVEVCAYRLTTKKIMVPLPCCPPPCCYGCCCAPSCGWGGRCW